MFRRYVLLFSLAFLFVSDAPAAPPQRPNVLIIGMGQVRADAAAKAPFLRELRSRGAVYNACSSTSDNPVVSTFSILTGLSSDAYYSTADRAENTFPAQLRRLGYRTGAVVANSNLRLATVRSLAGFERFLNLADLWTFMSDEERRARYEELDARLSLYGRNTNDFNRQMMYLSAGEVQRWAERLLDGTQPFFGYVNFEDAHDPYVPDPAHYDRTTEPVAVPSIRSRQFSKDVSAPDSIPDEQRREYVKQTIARGGGRAWSTALELTPEQLAVYHRRYEAEVLDLDRALRAFFAILEQRNLLDSTIVVITSTNGEEFGESGLLTHSFNELGDPAATRQVPLLMLFPRGYGVTNATLPARCSIADIVPTLYDALGVNAAPLWTSAAPLHGTSHAARIGVKRKYDAQATLATPPVLGPDDREITIRSQKDAAAKRRDIIRFVWGRDRLPAIEPFVFEDVCSPIPGMVNLARVDHLSSRVGQLESEAHHFIPLSGNGELVVLQVGHGCGPLDDSQYMDTAQGTARTIDGLVAAGYGVVAVRMPRQQPSDCGGTLAHVALFAAGPGTGMRYFLEPIAAAVNALDAKYDDVHMAGLSGGGWATTLYAAIDPRVSRSVQIAGSTPLYLRSARARGDIEETAPEFYSMAGYLDLYVLAAAGGEQRSHLQVLIRQDNCCFRAADAPDSANFERDTLDFENRIKSAVESAGGGSYELAVDEETQLHAISGYGFVEYVLPGLSGDL